MTPPTPKLPKLPPRGDLFVQKLIELGEDHPTEAAVAAGFPAHTAAINAQLLLAHSGVQATLRAAKWAKFDGTSVLLELAAIAFSDPLDLYDDAGRPKALTELKPDARRALASLDVDTLAGWNEDAKDDGTAAVPSRVVKARRWNKLEALKLLGNHFGVLRPTLSLEGADGERLEICLLAAPAKKSAKAPKRRKTT